MTEPLFTIEEAVQEIRDFPHESQCMTLERCFRKLGDREMMFFNGLDVLKVGKSECEPDNWQPFYEKLAALGVIEYTILCKQGKGMRGGGPHFKGTVRTTEFGKLVCEALCN